MTPTNQVADANRTRFAIQAMIERRQAADAAPNPRAERMADALDARYGYGPGTAELLQSQLVQPEPHRAPTLAERVTVGVIFAVAILTLTAPWWGPWVRLATK